MPKFRMPRPRKKLDARVRSATPSLAEDYDADEPQTKLSSAFIVVLLLHVVAVGGIYAFNNIKASRKDQEKASPTAATPTTAKQAVTPSTASASEKTAPAMNPVAGSAPAAITAPSVAKHYAVKQGDTLTSISKSTGVPVAELETANGLKPASTLRIGQSLAVPAKGAPKAALETAKTETSSKKAEDTAPAAGVRTYTVKNGDRLLFIAKRYNVTPDELIAVNKIKDPAKLKIGQSLKIPLKKTN
jgi:LysM repeat protein